MNLNEITVPVTCKVKYTKKMYYQKYLYKVTFEVDKSKLVRSSERSSFYRYVSYTNRLQLINDLVKETKKNIRNDDYRIRAESVRLSVFTSDPADVVNLISTMSARLVELERPLNDNHIEVIDKHRKVVVRNTLFENRYKFKIYLRYGFDLREARYSNVKEFLENLDGNWAVNSILDKFFYGKQSVRYLGYTAAVYLNSAEDLMMFQLKFNEDINKIEEAVLLSEL